MAAILKILTQSIDAYLFHSFFDATVYGEIKSVIYLENNLAKLPNFIPIRFKTTEPRDF